MGWLRAYAWWTLVLVAAIFVAFGIGDLLIGFTWDPGIPLALTGLTPGQIEAESAAAYRMLEFGTRSGGVNLIVIGLLFTVVLLIGFRSSQRWAWWSMWLMPAWLSAVAGLHLAFGIAPGQAPPPPLISGATLAVLTAAILLVSAPRFRDQPA